MLTIKCNKADVCETGMRGVLIAIVFYGVPALTYAGVRFVSPSGMATWPNCTSIEQTCSVEDAETKAMAGDVVLFLPGIYTGGLWAKSDGRCRSYEDDDAKKVVFQSYESGKAIIEGHRGTASTASVTLEGACLSLRNFSIKVPDMATSTVGVLSTGSNNEVAYNIIYYDGSMVPAADFAHADGIVIRNRGWVHHNKVHSVTVGIAIMGAASGSAHVSLVENNLIHDVNRGDLEDADCVTVNRNGTTGDFSGTIVRGNECYGWHDDAFDGFDSIGVEVSGNFFHDPAETATHPTCIKAGYYSERQLVRDNRCLGMPRRGGSVYCIDAQGTRQSEFVGNYCDGGRFGIYLQRGAGAGTGNTFVENTIVNAVEAGFFLAQKEATGARLIRNTFGGDVRDIFLTMGGAVEGEGNRFIHSMTDKGPGVYLNGHGDTEGPP